MPSEGERSQPPKGDPAQFALRAKPRPVTRLSRRTLVIAAAGLAILLLGSLWWALGLHPVQVTAGPELYNTDAKPSDAIGAVPGGYAALTKPKPVPPAPSASPTVSPAIGAGQSSAMMPQASSLPMSASGAGAQERERNRQQAAASGVFFTVSAQPAIEGSTKAPARVDAAAASGNAPTADPETGRSPQDHKQAFLDSKVDTAIYSPQQLQRPRSPDQLMAGTVIAAALVTGLDSDLPGTVIAQVTEDTFDSVTGGTLLVPQGSRLLGKYDTIVAYGQSRVLLAWTRLIRPDGSSILLDNLPAADTEGYAGLEDGVDYHTWRLLGGIAFSTLLGIGSELANNSETTGSGQANISVAIRQSGDNAANQTGQRIVGKDLEVQPTLTIRPGYPVRVMVNRDIILEPYRR